MFFACVRGYLFLLSLSSFFINTLVTSYLTPFTFTILTLCVIIFLKTVIINNPVNDHQTLH